MEDFSDGLGFLKKPAFTTRLAHPEFPNYGVRVKKSISAVKVAYTGYIDIQVRHMFFYFFESRSNPDEDDVNGTVHHPESWNSNQNILFIHQSIGVGFSYAEYGEYVSTTQEAARDIAAFVAIFFAHFTKFQMFAAAVYDQNPRLVKAGILPINFTSVCSQPIAYTNASAGTSRSGHRSLSSVQDIQVHPHPPMPRCVKWLKESCAAAADFCFEAAFTPYLNLGLNTYDISKTCDQPGGLCYEEIVQYLNREEVQQLLGVEVPRYDKCSTNVHMDFELTLDMYHGTAEYVAALLEHDVHILIYVDTYDLGCNWIANEVWTPEFSLQPLREWAVDGKRGGRTRSAKRLTFATVDAGHRVPYDKPKESLQLVHRWIAGQPL
ncbi:Alpha/Beta hydrolase protein [Mycena alexandri]|uniref:carboxypeptidase C n=1 Tax=Mycena alexandri TaxID=1745969 RepID=A0AAD6SH14_9AGAR|nr:Alpha/Beta hydrolase protein [Mycena alexandri]